MNLWIAQASLGALSLLRIVTVTWTQGILRFHRAFLFTVIKRQQHKCPYSKSGWKKELYSFNIATMGYLLRKTLSIVRQVKINRSKVLGKAEIVEKVTCHQRPITANQEHVVWRGTYLFV